MKNIIKNLSSSIPIGNSSYFTCPKCHRPAKLGITKNPDVTIYQCFSASCDLKGAIKSPLDKETLSVMLKNKTSVYTPPFNMPDYFVEGLGSDDSLKLALKYNLISGYGKRAFKTYYDPKLHRQVFLHTNLKGDVVGAMGRALRVGQKPKAHIYLGSEKTPWKIGDSKTLVVVEDILSAIQVYNAGCTGIALSGTSIKLDYLNWFKGYDTIILCLDYDAAIKSIEMKKLLDLCSESVIIKLIYKDVKDMTLEEAKGILVDK